MRYARLGRATWSSQELTHGESSVHKGGQENVEVTYSVSLRDVYRILRSQAKLAIITISPTDNKVVTSRGELSRANIA
jgi:hypothetical protein